MGKNNPNFNIENINASIEFNLEEVKSKYMKNGKIALSELFETLRSENEYVFYNNNRITVICEKEKLNVKFFIHPSGKILCWGAKSKEEIYNGIEKCFQKVINIMSIKKYDVSITNIMCSAVFDYKINLDMIAEYDENDCEINYEPEIFHARLTCKSKLGTVNIFRNGKIIMFMKKTSDASLMIKHIEEIISMKKAAIL